MLSSLSQLHNRQQSWELRDVKRDSSLQSWWCLCNMGLCVCACVHLHGILEVCSWGDRDIRPWAFFSNSLVTGNRKLVSIAKTLQMPSRAVVLRVWFLDHEHQHLLESARNANSRVPFRPTLSLGGLWVLTTSLPRQFWYAKVGEPPM